MAFCPKCGQQLAENTKFCTHCGEKVAEPTAAPQTAAQPHPQPAAAPAAEGAPAHSVPSAAKPAAKKSPLLLIVLGVLVLAVLAFAAARLFGEPATNADKDLSAGGAIGNVTEGPAEDTDPAESADPAARLVGLWTGVDITVDGNRCPTDRMYGLLLQESGSCEVILDGVPCTYTWSCTEDGALLVHDSDLMLVVDADGDEISMRSGDGDEVRLVKDGSAAAEEAARELESIVGSWYLVSGISGDVEFTLEDTPVDLFCLILWGDSTARLYMGTDYVDYAWSILEDGSLQLYVLDNGAVLNAVINGDMLTFENEDPNNYMWAQLQKGEPLYLDEGYYEEHSEPAAGGVQEGDSDGPVVDEPLTEAFLIGLWEAYDAYAYDAPITLEELCGGDMRVNFVADGGWCSIGGDVADISWSITGDQLNMTRADYPFYGYRMGDNLMLGFADEYGTVWFYLQMIARPE